MSNNFSTDADFIPFDKAFQYLVSITGSDEMAALDDFLSFTIAGVSTTIKVDLSNRKEEEINALNLLYKEWIFLMEKKVRSRGEWYDAFGNYYEMYSSKWRRSNKGQFFTPEAVVEIMVQITAMKGSGLTISDPACGSGRMLICSHVNNPTNYHFGEDIDKTCCMMAALNMFIHGAEGEIVWHDSLDYDSYYGGWLINPNFSKTHFPHIENLEKENSFIWRMNQARKNNPSVDENEVIKTQKIIGFGLFNDSDFE